MELDVTESVNAFREIISASWISIKQISLDDTTGSFLDDWLQANWERVVESSITPSRGVILTPYGDGADCNIGSSRVWRPDLLPNTPVFARYVGNETLVNTVDGLEVVGNLELSHFCTIVGGWPVIDTPFDYIALATSDVTIIPTENLRYYIQISCSAPLE